MFRLVPSLSVAMATLMLAAPALAADYGFEDEFRPAYPEDWDMSNEGDSLGFELGVRYWYSWGATNADFGGLTVGVNDQTHSGEVYAKIEDDSTSTYVKGYAGHSFAMGGTYDLAGTTGEVIPGRVAYAVGDFGWLPFGNGESVQFGGIAGYQYWNDSPNIGRGDFAIINSSSDITWAAGSPTYSFGGDSAVDNLDIHALRLGFTAKAELGEFFDIQAEVAAIPYAWISGTLGAQEIAPVISGNTKTYKSSATALNGFGFGAAGEMMVGFHPTENLTIRLGGRAWYLTGQLDASFDTATVTDPEEVGPPDGVYEIPPSVATQRFIIASDFASLFRYGALAELTWKF